MGVSAGPDIIEDGLVLALDAADKNSYPGSGTTWYDLSENNNSGSLTNGPTFDSDNLGSIVFDGSNDYVTQTVISRSADFTMNAWVKFNITSSNNAVRQYIYTQQQNPPSSGSWYTYQQRQGIMLAGNYIAGQYFNPDLINQPTSFYFAGVPDRNDIAARTASIVSPNEWYYITMAGDSTGAYLYMNGVLASSNTSASLSTPVNQAFIGRRGDDQGEDYINGNVSHISEYNRALSADEVLQNYNATKARFGL